jgi:dTMP kinase
MSGKLITIEGVDGSGKSTQIQLLKDYLIKQNINQVITTKEPGGTKLGQQIRELLLQSEMSPKTELLLYACDRNHHIETVILPALNQDKWVLCDRFIDSTYAYQCFGRELPRELIYKVNYLISAYEIKPSLTFWLDIPIEESLKRIIRDKDRIESADLSFHQRVQAGYQQLFDWQDERFKHPDSVDRIHRIDATKSIDQVHSQIVEVIQAML